MKINAATIPSVRPETKTQPASQQPPTCPDLVVILRDDMETENQNWLLRGPWGKVDAEGHGKAFSDSPAGNYEPNSNVRLVSQPLKLECKDVFLEFDLKTDTQGPQDPVTVEIAENHPHKTTRHDWVELARYDGQQDWQHVKLPLAGWEGKEIQFRFRLQSDAEVQKDGLLVDNVLLAGHRPD